MSAQITKLDNNTLSHAASYLDAASLAAFSGTCTIAHQACSAPHVQKNAVYVSEEVQLSAAARVFEAAANLTAPSHTWLATSTIEVIPEPREFIDEPKRRYTSEYEVWKKKAAEKKKAAFALVKASLGIESPRDYIQLDYGMILRDEPGPNRISITWDSNNFLKPEGLSELAETLKARAKKCKAIGERFQQKASAVAQPVVSGSSALYDVD
jgi:hypothetical protein